MILTLITKLPKSRWGRHTWARNEDHYTILLSGGSRILLHLTLNKKRRESSSVISCFKFVDWLNELLLEEISSGKLGAVALKKKKCQTTTWTWSRPHSIGLVLPMPKLFWHQETTAHAESDRMILKDIPIPNLKAADPVAFKDERVTWPLIYWIINAD